jgi:transposase
MKSLQTLINAAALKGFLKAIGADAEAIAWAQAIIDAEIAREGEREVNQGERIPQRVPESVHSLTEDCDREDVRRHQEKSVGYDVEDKKLAIILPETAQGEANEPSAADVVPEDKNASVSDGDKRRHWSEWQKETMLSMRAEGKKRRDIAAVIGKTASQISEMTKYLRRREQVVQDRLNMGLPAKKPLPGFKSKLSAEQLSEIKRWLATKSFNEVGEMYGVSGQTIINFLDRHGEDHKKFKKQSGRAEKRGDQEDDWPQPVKPEKTMSLVGEAKPADQPRMKFKRIKCKDSWGNETERQVPVPLGKYKDPDTGAKVTKYPPGYAYGAHEQKNVHVKGGA